MILLSAVAQSHLKRNKKKYYKNLVSVSLMRFTAKATTRNMCVVVLLLFVCCGSAFYGMQYTLNDFVMDSKTDRTFSMHYPVLEKQIGAREIQDTAEKYKMEVQNYVEADAANLVISYECRDFNEQGTKYLNIYKEEAKASLFLPETAFEQIYQTELSMSDLFAYIMNDADYQDLSQGLQNQYREHLILKVPMNLPKIYWDSIWKEQQNCQIGSWDCGISGRKSRRRMQERHMGMIRSLICHPKIRQLYRIGSMLCMYICIIALAAIGVLTYVRSISVATDNKGIFESLTKLGADHAYQRMILKKQLAKIFLYPGIVGCGAGFLFSFMMDYTNDGGITAIEIKALGILLLLIAVFCFVLFSVYHVSLRKVEKIVNLN